MGAVCELLSGFTREPLFFLDHSGRERSQAIQSYAMRDGEAGQREMKRGCRPSFLR